MKFYQIRNLIFLCIVSQLFYLTSELHISNKFLSSLISSKEDSLFLPFPKQCPFNPNNKDITREPVQEVDSYFWQNRKKKENPLHNLKIGFGKSSFLFDYLDPLLREPMLNDFKRLFEKAKEMKPADDYEDKLTFLNYYHASQECNTEETCAEKYFKENSKNVAEDTDIWRNSISAGQLANLITTWGWDYSHLTDAQDYVNAIVQMYDFNGDGRLSMEELLQVAIDINLSGNKPKNGKCKFCFRHLKELLDEIYEKSDTICGNGEISAEELWFTLKYLNRPTNDFNMYNCEVYLRGNLRTSAVNDFVLKMRGLKYGSLRRNEFATGIAYGILNRQVRENRLVFDEEFNNKNSRYSADILKANEKEKYQRKIIGKLKLLLLGLEGQNSNEKEQLKAQLTQAIESPLDNELLGTNDEFTEEMENKINEIEKTKVPGAFTKAEELDKTAPGTNVVLNPEKEDEAAIPGNDMDYICKTIVKAFEGKELNFD